MLACPRALTPEVSLKSGLGLQEHFTRHGRERSLLDGFYTWQTQFFSYILIIIAVFLAYSRKWENFCTLAKCKE